MKTGLLTGLLAGLLLAGCNLKPYDACKGLKNEDFQICMANVNYRLNLFKSPSAPQPATINQPQMMTCVTTGNITTCN